MTRELVRAKELAEMLGISIRTLWNRDATGKLPEAVTLGGRCKMWRVREITAWIDRGCPHRTRWKWEGE